MRRRGTKEERTLKLKKEERLKTVHKDRRVEEDWEIVGVVKKGSERDSVQDKGTEQLWG